MSKIANIQKEDRYFHLNILGLYDNCFITTVFIYEIIKFNKNEIAVELNDNGDDGKLFRMSF